MAGPTLRQIHNTNDTRPWINRDGMGSGSADWDERVLGWVGNTGKRNLKEKQWENKTNGKTKRCGARLTKNTGDLR